MLPLFAQELPTSCVAACARMVLAGLGYPLPEAHIRKRCGHTLTGMRLNQIAAGLRDLPVSVEYRIDWNLDDLAHSIQRQACPIVGIDLRPVEGVFAFHAVVVINIATDQFVVHDPLYNGAPRLIGQLAFEAAWDWAHSVLHPARLFLAANCANSAN